MKQTNDEFVQAFRKASDSASRSLFTSFESVLLELTGFYFWN